MPTEPTQAVPVTPDTKADAPVTIPDQPTTTTTTDKSDIRDVLAHLDIPDEVKERIAPKTEEKPKVEAEAEPQTTLEPKPEQPKEETPEEEPEEEESEEVAAEAEQPEEQPQKIDKRQKRINRLTRQKSELEAKLDELAAENAALKGHNGSRPEDQPAPLIGGRLPVIQQEIEKADAILAWCDNNAEGGEVGEGDKATFYDPKTIRQWRRDAEQKRQELVVAKSDESKVLAQVRSQADQDAFAICPEMFDKTKPEYQEAVAYIRQYPFITAIPEANRALALLVTGRKTLEAKAGKNGNVEHKPKGDIDPRVFTTPRVPIAPHTPEPPSRESKKSSQTKYNEAMSKHLQDPDGNHLLEAFAALEEANRGQVGGRTSVKS